MISVLIGANKYLLEKEVTARKNKFLEVSPGGLVESYFYDQLDSDKLTIMLTSSSLFSQKRLVILKDLSQSVVLGECLMSISNKIADGIDILLVESKIDKRKSFYKTLKKEFETKELGDISEFELAKWISDYITEIGGTIAQKEVTTLMRFVGNDQMSLKNEAEKLVAYDNQVSEKSINLLVEKRPEDSVFQLLEASLNGKTKMALEILNNLEQAHEDPFAVANMLIWQTHILAITYSAKNVSDSEITKITKLKPYVVQKTHAISRRLSAHQFRKIVDSVAELDINLKSSKSKPWRLLEQAIISL